MADGAVSGCLARPTTTEPVIDCHSLPFLLKKLLYPLDINIHALLLHKLKRRQACRRIWPLYCLLGPSDLPLQDGDALKKV